MTGRRRNSAPELTLLAVGFWAIAMTSACQGSPRGEHSSVLEIAREANEPVNATTRPTPPAGTQTVAAHVTTGVSAFDVLARQSRVPKTPCSGCHVKPLNTMRWNGSDGHPTAHWQVELVHASKAVMTCTTCHTPDTPGTLRTLAGEPVAFDHAYEVCAQCHSKQRNDWEGGAHGKRAVGWETTRVIFNCTECHNPHRPAFDTRWPARAGRADR